jgi:hypothetical protein
MQRVAQMQVNDKFKRKRPWPVATILAFAGHRKSAKSFALGGDSHLEPPNTDEQLSVMSFKNYKCNDSMFSHLRVSLCSHVSFVDVK